MKKIFCTTLICFMLVGVLFAFSSCGGDKGGEVFTCGVTEYEPMNWRDGGEWTGFDTEFALLVGEKLGMEINFQIIEWSQKFAELESGAIDAIWNGFTATASENGVPRLQLCDMSYSYMTNTQCFITRKDRLAEFSSEADLEGKIVAAEAGSAGESEALDYVGETGTVIGVSAQINTFMEIMAGACDGGVIDVILAQQRTGTGDYADLVIAFELNPEVYAIGFRKGDPLRDKVNKAMLELYEEGALEELAAKYELEDKLLVDKNFGN